MIQPLTFFLSVFRFENVFGGEHQTINLTFFSKNKDVDTKNIHKYTVNDTRKHTI